MTRLATLKMTRLTAQITGLETMSELASYTKLYVCMSICSRWWNELGDDSMKYLICLWTRSATVEPKCDADFKSGGQAGQIEIRVQVKERLDREDHEAQVQVGGAGISTEARGELWRIICTKPTTFRLMLELAQINNLWIHQLDVDSAFLYAPLDKEVFMKPPPDM